MARNKKKAGRSRREMFKKGLMKQVDKSIKKHDQRRKGFSIIDDDSITIWRPKYGTHIIDLIPYLAGKEDPQNSENTPVYTFTYYVHRFVGPANADVICLEQMGKGTCAICEHRNRLREEGKSDEIWKKLFPKERNLYNVVCYNLNEEAKGIQIWDESEFYSQRNISPLAREKGRGGAKDKKINFVDPDNGKSIEFEIQAPVSKDDYKKYIGFKFRKRDGYTLKDSILDDANTLDELIEYPSEEMVEEIYWGEEGKSGDEEQTESDDNEAHEDPYELLEDSSNVTEILNIVQDYDLETTIRKKTPFKKAKRLLRKALDEQWVDSDDADPDEGDDPKAAAEESLSEAEDISDLKAIVKEHDLDVSIKKSSKFKKTKRLVAEAIEEMVDASDEPEHDPAEIRDMSMKQLKALNQEEELGLKSKKYDDEEDFAEAIIEKMELETDND